jgi:hypothetical protein
MKQWLQQQLATIRSFRSWTDAFNAIGNKTVIHNLPFLMYCVVLGLSFVYIEHNYENRSRQIDKLTTKVRELNWAFKDEKTKLMFLTKQNEIANKAMDLGLQENIVPPNRIVINQNN